MTPQEAEKIVNLYGGAVAYETGTARKKSLLPCSVAKIKYAYFVYIEYLMENDLFTNEIKNSLILTYSLLNNFINDEEVEEINLLNEKYKNKHLEETGEEREEIIRYNGYITLGLKKMMCLTNEIGEYINDFYKKYPQN